MLCLARVRVLRFFWRHLIERNNLGKVVYLTAIDAIQVSSIDHFELSDLLLQASQKVIHGRLEFATVF